MKISKKFFPPFIICTDLKADLKDFSQDYNDLDWLDSNDLYKNYIVTVTFGKKMKKFFVKELKKMSQSSLRLVATIFKSFNISPTEFRCDFFKVLPGGFLPYHIDQKSKISFCLPITKNTGYTHFKNESVEMKIQYQSMIVLNNKELHKVSSPTSERVLFRIGVHDVSFEDLLYKNNYIKNKLLIT